MLVEKRMYAVLNEPHTFYHAALESLSSLTVLILGSFFSRSNHMTSTRFFLMYFNTSITLPSVLLRTCSPFLTSLLILLIVFLAESIIVFGLRVCFVCARKDDQLARSLISDHLIKLFNGSYRSVVQFGDDKSFTHIRVTCKFSIAQ